MIFKKSFKIFFAIFICIVFVYKYYEITVINKKVVWVRDIYENLSNEEKNPPPKIKEIVLKIEGTKNIARFVVRQFARLDKKERGNFFWHSKLFIWEYFFLKKLSQDELIAFYIHYLPYENGIGWVQASKNYFQKKLSDLTEDEILTLLIIGKGPRVFSPTKNPERFEKMKSLLKQKLLVNS